MGINAAQVKELRERTGAGMLDCKKALTETNGNIEEAIVWLREKGISKAAKKADRIAAEGLTVTKIVDGKAVIAEINSETDFVAKNEQFLALIDTLANAVLAANTEDVSEILESEFEGTKVSDIIINATATIGEKISLRRVSIIDASSDEGLASYAHNGGTIGVIIKTKGSNAEAARGIAMHIAAINPQYLDDSQIPADVLEAEKAALTKEALEEGKPAEIVEKMIVGRMKKFTAEICLVDQSFVKEPDFSVGKYAKNQNIQILDFTRFEVGEGIEKEEVDFAAEVASVTQS